MQEPFRPEQFQKILLHYLMLWGIMWLVIVVLPLVKGTEPIEVGGKTLLNDTTAIGYIASALFALGIVSWGPGCSVGVLAVGPGAIGIIAIGGGGACGVYAVGWHAVGIFAIGMNAIGVYTLSHSESGKGKYVFSPKRQDAKAVKLYTRWFPHFKGAYQPDAEEKK